MKSRLLVFIILLCSTALVGQTETTAYKAAVDSFVVHYNAGRFEAVFQDFAPVMQAALPLDKTKQFFTALQSQNGDISNRQFLKYNQTYASYKAVFDKSILTLNISVDDSGKINGLYITAYRDANLPKIDRNKTKLILPFREEWTVIWGGDTKELNYHVASEAQKNAFDILIANSQGDTHTGDGAKNEDYYAFGKDIIAPCDAEVALAVDGVKDNIPGIKNPTFLTGNTVILKTANNEYLLFAHFKQYSVAVREGQKVKQGQLLGKCGNSGNSTEPHLHFHIQNIEDMSMATGVKCYFDNILVNGQLKTDYSPIQKDKINNPATPKGKKQ